MKDEFKGCVIIPTKEIRVDIYTRGANNPHIRLTHIPTGMTSECDTTPSLYKNKEIAFELMRQNYKEQFGIEWPF